MRVNLQTPEPSPHPLGNTDVNIGRDRYCAALRRFDTGSTFSDNL